MRARAHALFLLLLVVGLTAFPSAALATPPSPPATAARQSLTIVTMRLGISAGDKIQDLVLGTNRRELEPVIPELFETASGLGVRIDEVAVGRGFWSDDGTIENENDLDLVVTGLRENILALGAAMGQQWNQSAVLAWEMQVEGSMLTATIPVTGGVTPFTEQRFEQFATILTDGGHIRFGRGITSPTLVFVAHTGDDSDGSFRQRMVEAQQFLDDGGLVAVEPVFAQAEMVELNRANYQRFIDGAVRGKAA